MSTEESPFTDYDGKQAEVNQRRELEREQELADISVIVNTNSGLRFFKRLMADSHVFHSTFNPDAAIAAFSEGQRNLGLRYLSDVAETAPALIPQLIVTLPEPPSPEVSDINK